MRGFWEPAGAPSLPLTSGLSFRYQNFGPNIQGSAEAKAVRHRGGRPVEADSESGEETDSGGHRT